MFGSDHTRLKSHSCSKPHFLFVTFDTNGANAVTIFRSSSDARNPITVGGVAGSPVISGIGRFRALRAAIRFSGPTTTTVTPDGENGTIQLSTVLSNTYEFLFLLDSY